MENNNANMRDLFKTLTDEQKQKLGLTEEDIAKTINEMQTVEQIEPEEKIELKEGMIVEEKKDNEQQLNSSVKSARDELFSAIEETESKIEVVHQEPAVPESAINKTKEKVEEKETVNDNKMKTKKDVLSKFKIDNLSEIMILDNYTIDNYEAFKGMNFNINGKPTTETVCNQSCYIAQMEGLNYSDLVALKNSSAGIYSAKQRLYKTIYSKINTTSLGNIDFKTFLDITTLFDMESLIYGVYCQTFEDETEFNVTCAHCGNTINVKFTNNQLIFTKDDKVYGRIKETIQSVHNPMEARKKSVLNEVKRVILPESKIIIDLKIPSLSDQLDLLSKMNEEKARAIEDIVNVVFFTKEMFKPDLGSFLNGKPAWVKVANPRQYIPEISGLSYEDQKYLNKEMEEFVGKYRVDYAVPSFKCSNCEQPTGDIQILMEQMLFLRIAE